MLILTRKTGNVAIPGSSGNIMLTLTTLLQPSLAIEIQRSMDYYEHNYRQAPIRSLAILPIPVMLYGFTDALQQTLGLDTRSVSMSDTLECNQDPDADTTARCLLAVGCALGMEKKEL